MKRRQWTTLAGIAILFIFTLYLSLPSTPGVPIEIAGRDFSSLSFRQGLDLQGGKEFLLAPKIDKWLKQLFDSQNKDITNE